MATGGRAQHSIAGPKPPRRGHYGSVAIRQARWDAKDGSTKSGFHPICETSTKCLAARFRPTSKPSACGTSTHLKDQSYPDESRLLAPARTAGDRAAAAPKDHFFGWKEPVAEDDRWQRMDTGRFFSGTIRSAGQTTTKAIAIRVGPGKTGRLDVRHRALRFSCAWSGPFLAFNPKRYGLIGMPAVAGNREVSYSGRAGLER